MLRELRFMNRPSFPEWQYGFLEEMAFEEDLEE